eukprot:CAMPEP_0172773102 /NCGR_PEP_ID=MMETSP1074-20121228/193655_1 /TAXON_ID=2916 /ORGANISM="Ceratium fusus, Strain PA161109" /LENGTH=137 /DNA_ID=CAMNT_0013609331 /DNA_START=238 /DNA_END=651 /DNA_ORIENTATION=-
MAVEVILQELALIRRSICPAESAKAALTTAGMLTLVPCTIGPNLAALPMLAVFTPFSLILGARSMAIRTLPVCFVVFPLSLVDVAISVVESAMSRRSVVLPLPGVFPAVGPDLGSYTMPHMPQPLSSVSGPIPGPLL